MGRADEKECTNSGQNRDRAILARWFFGAKWGIRRQRSRSAAPSLLGSGRSAVAKSRAHDPLVGADVAPYGLSRVGPRSAPRGAFKRPDRSGYPTAAFKTGGTAGCQKKGGFGWHQDFAFFPHTNTDLVAIMVMLDDATEENGCMHMVRGSHKMGLLDHMDGQGLFSTLCKEERVWSEQPENITPITPRAGGISMHHCLMVHGSGPNASGQPRRGLVFQYRADDAFQLADGVWGDTGLMVSGQRRERARCDAGVLRLPKSQRLYRPTFWSCLESARRFCRRDQPPAGRCVFGLSYGQIYNCRRGPIGAGAGFGKSGPGSRAAYRHAAAGTRARLRSGRFHRSGPGALFPPLVYGRPGANRRLFRDPNAESRNAAAI